MDPGTVTLTINGHVVTAAADATILETVQNLSLDTIPALCHSPELPPYGSCFLCVVEVKGRPNLVPSCATRVAQGMEVQTRNDRINASRKTALELLISNHYADCLAPCRLSCPAGVDTQGYIALAAMGDYSAAIEVIRRNNPLPAVCGRICVRKCEIECRRKDHDQPVNINAVKRFLSDTEGAYDSIPSRLPPTGKSVGIVGAGPGGLSAAWFLAGSGHEAVIYEAMDRPGGMLRYGIPSYRLPEAVLDKEVDHILRRGVRVLCSTRVGRDVTLEELYRRHDALFIASGAWAAKPMGLEGEAEIQGVLDGIDFLGKTAGKPEPLSGTVVVVGGGNTAVDVARTAWRCGASRVVIAYRRTRAEMPADPLEVADCLKEGIELTELTAPVALVSVHGKLTGLRCIRMELGEPDGSGRRRPVEIEGSEFVIECSTAIAAIGQAPSLEGLLEGGGKTIVLTKRKTIAADPVTMRTNIEGIFAGGDAADDGPTVVVDAIRDGKRAAESIHTFLTGEVTRAAPFIVRKEIWGVDGVTDDERRPVSRRREAHELEVERRRGNFNEVSEGLHEHEIAEETGRCLSCGCVGFDECKLRRFAEEYGADISRFHGKIRKHKIDDRHPTIVYDPNKCILCTRCVRTCERILPLPALGLTGRGFTSEIRPSMNDPLDQTNCIGCGNCIDACPTAALTEKYHFKGRAAIDGESVETHCGLCSISCGITVRIVGDGSFFIRSAGSGTYICRYGRFGPMSFTSNKRLSSAVVREGECRREIRISEGVALAAAALREAVRRDGAEKTGVFLSGELSNEELYLGSIIAREGLGTNNIGSLSMLLQGTPPGAFDRAFGFTASTVGMEILATADLIVCSNTDPLQDHLPLGVQVTDAVRRGANLIALNSVPGSFNALSQVLVLDPLRGSSTVFWYDLIGRMIHGGILTKEAIAKLQDGAAFISEIERHVRVEASGVTGVSEAKLVRAARLLSEARTVVFIHGIDRETDRAPHDCEILANLMILLRTRGTRTELLLPRLAPNGAGLEISGAVPEFLPGRTESRGLAGSRSSAELRDALRAGNLKSALIIGEDPFLDDATRNFFRNITKLVAIDWKITETVHFADVALPGTSYLESNGTRCDFLGNPVRFSPTIAPPSGMPGWRVMHDLAIELGASVPAHDFEGISHHLENVVVAGTGRFSPLYWNHGEDRRSEVQGKLAAVRPESEPAIFSPFLTHSGRYRKMLRDINV